MPDNDDPFKPPETILRPRPGGGKRSASDVAVSAPAYRAPSAAVDDPIGAATGDVVGVGLNPLVQAASPLLLLAGHLRGTLSAPDLQGLRRHAMAELRRFEDRAGAAGIAGGVIRAAHYVLCAGLDEAVLSTPWGAHSEWTHQTLLNALHREGHGGEKFFEMLKRIGDDPSRHVDLMELQYLCLAFGFAGRYDAVERGHARLAEIQQALYRKIHGQRDVAPPELSPRWQGVKDRRHRLIRYVPWWVIGAAALAILAIAFAVYYSRLAGAAGPIHAALANIGRDEFTGPPPAAPAAGPTLKQLLASDEARGSLSVEEQGGRTTITLTASNLFGSGSAAPNGAYLDMLRRIAGAIEQVPGRVMVVGHTDDQPLRSLRYANNFELSRERAASVVRLLQGGSKNPSRFESTGVGSAEPRYRPESDPENRARNRRVEIIHVP
jgi:type VI secretion system protein ImpK